MRRFLILAAAVAALVCALAPAAQAGTPFTVGEGKAPHLVVDPSGTAHVVWIDDTTEIVHYCQVPRGESACALSRDIPAGDSSTAPAFILLTPSGLLIAMADYVDDRTLVWTSSDNGASWSGRQQIYGFGEATDPAEPLFGPQAGQLTFAGFNPANPVWAAALNGDEGSNTAHADLPGPGFDIAIAPTTDGGLVATGDDLSNTSFWRLPPGADPSSTAAWSAATAVGPGGDTRVAGGSSGTYLLSTVSGSEQIRKWTGTAFGAADTVDDETGYINDISVGPSGAVAAIWRRNGTPNDLRLALSTNEGATYPVGTIVEEDSIMASMDVSLAPDEKGFVTYEGAQGSDGAHSLIRVASTNPAGGASPNPGSKSKSAKIGGKKVKLTGPGNCVEAGKTITAKLSGKGVRRAVFSLGGKKPKKDKKKPFKAKLTVPRAPDGAKLTLRGKATVGKGSKTIKLKVKTC